MMSYDMELVGQYGISQQQLQIQRLTPEPKHSEMYLFRRFAEKELNSLLLSVWVDEHSESFK